jgi:hypothetical protein
MQTEKNDETVGAGKITKIDRYKWQVQDEPGIQQMVNKHRLLVDKEYQRNTNDMKVLTLAREWSWIACSSITVALRDGEYYVVDGQHRVAAAMRRSDITELPCLVFKTAGIAVEAKGFLAANTQRKPMYSSEKFKALVVTESTEALLVQELAAQAGRHISRDTSPSTIGCIGLLLRLAKANPATLQKMWPMLTDVCKGYNLHERIVDGLMYLETNMPEGESLTDRKWRSRIEKVGYAALLDAAAKASAFYSRGGAKVWALGMLEAINKGLRERLEINQSA